MSCDYSSSCPVYNGKYVCKLCIKYSISGNILNCNKYYSSNQKSEEDKELAQLNGIQIKEFKNANPNL